MLSDSEFKAALKNLLAYCRGTHDLDSGRDFGPLLLDRECQNQQDEFDLLDAFLQRIAERLQVYRQQHDMTAPVVADWKTHKHDLPHDVEAGTEIRIWSALWAYYGCRVKTHQIVAASGTGQDGLSQKTIQTALQKGREIEIPRLLRQLEQQKHRLPLAPSLHDLLPLSSRVVPGSAPAPPRLFIGRDSDVQALRTRLIPDSEHQGSAHVNVLTAMHGWPGVGKTTLAAALAHDQEVLRQFPDGVLWASLGQSPNIFAELQMWCRALNIPDAAHIQSVEEASARLAAILRTEKRLLLIDDVWEPTHVTPFLVGGTRCSVIVTTRLRDVARIVASTPHHVYLLDVLDAEDALVLLQTLAPHAVGDDIDLGKDLVQELEYLPLGIQVAGRLLETELSYGFGIEHLLDEIREGVALMDRVVPPNPMHPDEAPRSVMVLLQKSTDHLDTNSRDCFAFMGAFAPKPATFSLAALQAVWDVDDPKPIVRTLVDRGLLEPTDQGRFWMHALLVSHAKKLLEDEDYA